MLLALRHRWSDGTTHLRLHPLELLERLAAVTPRPRINLVLKIGTTPCHPARAFPAKPMTSSFLIATRRALDDSDAGRGMDAWEFLERY